MSLNIQVGDTISCQIAFVDREDEDQFDVLMDGSDTAVVTSIDEFAQERFFWTPSKEPAYLCDVRWKSSSQNRDLSDYPTRVWVPIMGDCLVEVQS